MAKLTGIVRQLKKEQDRLTRQLKGVAAALAAFGGAYGKRMRRGKLSAAGRARIAAAQRARWAKVKGESRKKGGPKKHTSKATTSKKSRRPTKNTVKSTADNL